MKFLQVPAQIPHPIAPTPILPQNHKSYLPQPSAASLAVLPQRRLARRDPPVPPPCSPSSSSTDGIHVLSRHRRRWGSTSSVSTSLLASDFASPSSRPRPTASITRPPLHSARRRLRRIRCRAFFFQLGWQGSWCAWWRDSVGGLVLPVGLVNLAKEFLGTVESQLRSTNPSSTPCSSRLCRIAGWSADGLLICPYCMEQNLEIEYWLV